MKIYICLTILVLTLVDCNHKDKTGNLHITGNIKGFKKGKLYIQKIIDTSLIVIDTFQIDGDSNFETYLDIESPEMYYIFLDRGITNSLDNSLPFFAEVGEINIETSLDGFQYNAKISGSKNHEKYEEFRKITSRFNDYNLDLEALKINSYKNNKLKTIDSIIKKQDENYRRRYLFTTNFALNNKNLEVAPFVTLAEISDINLKYLDTIQKSMTPKVARSMYGKKLKKFYLERKENIKPKLNKLQ